MIDTNISEINVYIHKFHPYGDDISTAINHERPTASHVKNFLQDFLESVEEVFSRS